jgi:hypothetical protein
MPLLTSASPNCSRQSTKANCTGAFARFQRYNYYQLFTVIWGDLRFEKESILPFLVKSWTELTWINHGHPRPTTRGVTQFGRVHNLMSGRRISKYELGKCCKWFRWWIVQNGGLLNNTVHTRSKWSRFWADLIFGPYKNQRWQLCKQAHLF